MLDSENAKFMMRCLPFWNDLSEAQRQTVLSNAGFYRFDKKSYSVRNADECVGLMLVKTGQLRAFITSEDGKEISLYRLLPMDICIMSASCMLKNINFDIHLEFERDSELLILPTPVFEKINKENPAVKTFTLNLVTSRFSDVMWVLEQLVFSNMGKRLAAELVEQSNLEQNLQLDITHEQIAKDLGTAREVVTRLLKQFQLDHLVKLSRSKIEIVDIKKLEQY